MSSVETKLERAGFKTRNRGTTYTVTVTGKQRIVKTTVTWVWRADGQASVDLHAIDANGKTCVNQHGSALPAREAAVLAIKLMRGGMR